MSEGLNTRHWAHGLKSPALLGRIAAPFVVLLVGLVLTVLAVQRQLDANEAAATRELDAVATRFANDLHDRLQRYQYGLRGARGVFAAAGPDKVSREAFLRYSKSRDIDIEFPGARGFGFIRRVRPAEIDDFVRFQHENGVPDFQIKQLKPHSGDQFVIEYIEPLERNAAALGLDMAGERNRRTAAVEAGLSGKPTITEPTTIVQASLAANRAFLVMLPVYPDSVGASTGAARYEHLVGWTYAPLVLDEVIGGLLDDTGKVLWQISDIREEGESNPIFEYSPVGYQEASLATSRMVDVFNRVWEVKAHASLDFVTAAQRNSPYLIGWVGLAASVSLSLIVSLWLAGQRRITSQREVQARLATVIENTHQAVVGTDLANRVVIWNRGAEVLFGVAASDATGRRYREVLAPEQMRVFDLLNSGKPGQQDIVLDAEQVGRRILSVSGSPIYSPKGSILGHAAFILDVTESRRVERRSAQDTEDFAYTVAHDLRTPLRSVNGFAALLLESEADRLTDSGRAQLETVVRSSLRMGQMLTSLIDYLHIIKQPVLKTVVDVEALARTVSNALRDNMGESTVHVAKLPVAHGDAYLLGVAMHNLLENAYKYCKPGETPQIFVEFDEVEAAYRVRDKGIGFDTDRAQKLFGLFQRLEPHPDIPGLGVGLAITRRIIEKHGGRMWAHSTKGEGASFYFSLPTPREQ